MAENTSGSGLDEETRRILHQIEEILMADDDEADSAAPNNRSNEEEQWLQDYQQELLSVLPVQQNRPPLLLLPGIRHLFQKRLTKTDVNIYLYIPVEAFDKSEQSYPSLKFHKTENKAAKISKPLAYGPPEISEADIQILDEQTTTWWRVKLVRVRHWNDKKEYELRKDWKGFVDHHKLKQGDQIHFYKLACLENEFAIAIQRKDSRASVQHYYQTD